LKKITKIFEIPGLEAAIWLSGMVYLFTIDAYSCEHFSFCIFNQLGIDFCPGCGIGRSISLFMHGEFALSFELHPLGIPAFFIIVYRIVSVVIKTVKIQQLLNREKKNGKCTSVNA